MALKYEEVLKKMGWVDGFRVPLANKENQALEAELETLMLRKAKATVSYNNADVRHKNLEKHLKYVLQESEQNQVLLSTYQQQILQERDILKCKQHEEKNVEQEIRKIQKAKDEIVDRSNQKRNDLQKSFFKLDKLRSESNWDTDALNAWDEALKRRDEDNNLLKQFSMEDQKKANELEARRKNLQTEVLKRKELVTKMAAELTNYEMVLDRTSKTFQKMKDERAAMVKQWEIAVRMLRQRNCDIEKVHLDLSNTQDVLEQQLDMLDDQNNFLEREQINNKELHFAIEDLNQHNSRIRRERNETCNFVLELKSELHSVKGKMVATANELESKRKQLKNISNDIEEKHDLVEKRAEEIETLRMKLDEIVHSSMTSDQRVKKLEQIIEDEEKNYNSLVQDHGRLQNVLYKNQQILYALQNAGKIKESSIDNFKSTYNVSKKQLSNIYSTLEKRKEVVYDIEYRINEMENRLILLDGNDKSEDIELLEEKIEALTEVLNKHTEVKVLLQKEIRRLNDEMRRLTSALSSDNVHHLVIKGKLQDQVLLFEGGLKQAAAAKQRSQEKQVEENVLKLKIDQFENAIKNQTSKLYNLQRFQLDLDCGMKEKQIAIENSLEILKIKKRHLEEEIHRLKCDVTSRNIRIEQFQKKHHLALMSFDKDNDGNPLSITQIKIKNAQEKYILVTEGDELDNKIQRTEGEILAMENTLKIINSTNVSYKKSLAPISETDEEINKMKQLEDQIYDARESIRSHKKLVANVQSHIKEMQQAIIDVQAKNNCLIEETNVLKEAYVKHRNEEEERNNKIVRADKQIKQITKKLETDVVAKYNKDFMIHQLQNANMEVLYKLGDLITKNTEYEAVIKQNFYDRNMELPKPRSLTSIFRNSSEEMSSVTSSVSICSSSSTDREIPRINLQFQECDVKRKSCIKKKKYQKP